MAEAQTPAGPSVEELVERLARARRQPADQHPPGFFEQALELLHHSDDKVREEAVRFLGRHFRQRSDAQVLLEMVVADSSAPVRKSAAECLGGIFRSTRNRQVNEVLAPVAQNKEEDAEVRAAAYAAIKRINGYGASR